MKVRMINSVGEYVAGEVYDLDDDTVERFVILGYAEGTLPRPINDEQRAAIEATRQVVTLGG